MESASLFSFNTYRMCNNFCNLTKTICQAALWQLRQKYGIIKANILSEFQKEPLRVLSSQSVGKTG